MADKEARILILGGGFGGLFTALDLTGAGRVTLVSPEDHFLFTPMLYEYLSGEVESWHIAPYYKELLDESVQRIRGEVMEIDLAAHEVGRRRVDGRCFGDHFLQADSRQVGNQGFVHAGGEILLLGIARKVFER